MVLKDHIKSACILAIDDEDTNLVLLKKTLEQSGFSNIVIDSDSRRTLELYLEHTPDVILLDLNMPYLDGFEVLEQLKAIAKDDLCPVIVITAQQQPEFCEMALEKGASDFVTKPFSIKEVSSRVRNLVEVSLFRKLMKKQNQMLEDKVKERTEQLLMVHEKLHDSRLQIVQRLGRAAEYRDNATGLHILRMSKIAALLAESIGMSEEECDLILNASPMHDIGKIGISDSILLKTGSLDPPAWDIMKTHAQIGANLLHGDESELLTMAREIALTHHERWNGTGYPNGLEEEAIPLAGRICALADVFDALTSERPYKEAWSVDDAMKYINDESGKHFDPELVKIFNEKLPEIESIMEEHAEPI